MPQTWLSVQKSWKKKKSVFNKKNKAVFQKKPLLISLNSISAFPPAPPIM